MPTLDCELYFLMRIHGKGKDKAITVKKQEDPSGRGHLLLPLFGAEPFQTLVHRAFEPPTTIQFSHPGNTPTERDFFSAAQVQVRELLGTQYDVLDAASIPSKWNRETRTWDPLPAPHQTQEAFGYLITDGTDPVESEVSLGTETLFVDFVVLLQKEVQP